MMGDTVPHAQLIECVPEARPEVSTVVPAAPDVSPVQAAMDATLETTGCDPPPPGDR